MTKELHCMINIIVLYLFSDISLLLCIKNREKGHKYTTQVIEQKISVKGTFNSYNVPEYSFRSQTVLFFTSCSFQDRIICCMFKKLLVAFHWNVSNTIGTDSMKLSVQSHRSNCCVFVFFISQLLLKSTVSSCFIDVLHVQHNLEIEVI